MCSSSGMLLTTVVDNSVLLLRIQKRFVKGENMPLDIYKARTISVMETCRTSQYLVSPGRMLLEVKFREFAAPKMGLFIFLIAGATESTE